MPTLELMAEIKALRVRLAEVERELANANRRIGVYRDNYLTRDDALAERNEEVRRILGEVMGGVYMVPVPQMRNEILRRLFPEDEARAALAPAGRE
jgi:hypothetical protein